MIMNQDRVEDIKSFCRCLRVDDITRFSTACEDARQSLKRNASTKLLLTWLAGQGDLILCKS